MYFLPYFVLLVLLVATTKILFEEQALVEDAKQSMQADKAVGPACFVLCLLLALALPSGFFYQLSFIEQSNFLRCLCLAYT
jgi:hypothetical protein